MRTYALNSPQAAARIVTMAMLADGHLSRAELKTLDRLGVHQQLGLSPLDLHDVVQAFCEDLFATAHGSYEAINRVDPQTIAELATEITDPVLRLQLLQLCAEVVEADAHLAEGESLVMTALTDHWCLQREMLRGGKAHRLAEPV